MLYSKQDDAQINIRPSEFGQRFGDWLLFVGSQKEKNRYEDVVLFSRAQDDKNGYFVIAKNAEVENAGGLLSLILKEGRSYQTGEEQMAQIDYAQMRVNEPGKLRALEFKGVIAHWMNRDGNKGITRDFVWAILAGVFVLICLPAAALGIHNPRFEKNRAGAIALVLTVLFYAPAMVLGNQAIVFTFLLPPVWLALILWLYRRRLRTF